MNIILLPLFILMLLFIIVLFVFIVNRKRKYQFDLIEPSMSSTYAGVTSDYGDVTGEYSHSFESSMSKWVLEIREPNINPRTYPLMNDSVVLIGRNSGSMQADICFDNDHISRSHAKIIIKNNICFIHDQGSKFGTFIVSHGINNQRLDKMPTELRIGDVIILGKNGIELELQEV